MNGHDRNLPTEDPIVTAHEMWSNGDCSAVLTFVVRILRLLKAVRRGVVILCHGLLARQWLARD
jgi:hypothetical protein